MLTKKERDRRYYLKNKEKVLAYSAKYRSEHPDYLRNYHQQHREELNAKQSLYQKAHPAQAIAKAKKWYDANHAKAMQIRAEWRKKNPGYLKKYYQEHKQQAYENSTRWQAANKDKVKLYRKAAKLKRRAVGFIDKATIQRIYEDNIKQYGTLTCYLCGNPIKFGDDSIDHKQPISRGGNNDYCNLAIAHLLCNKQKGNKLCTPQK